MEYYTKSMEPATLDERDELLVVQICTGNKELFGKLIDRYEEKLTRYVKRFTLNTDDVSDIVQTVFIKAYSNLQSFDTTRSFNAWIYRIAHNECVNHLKKKGNEKISFLDFDTFFPHPFAKETADEETIHLEDKAFIESSLSRVSPKYREVLVLYFYEDFSYQEISEILRIPVATVGVRLKRGKEALKKALEDKHYQS